MLINLHIHLLTWLIIHLLAPVGC